METFNVIIYDINRNKFKSFNIIPYLMDCYDEATKKPKTFKEFREFVDKESRYQFWARCQYEVILVDWPCQQHEEKWDVYDQIKMNLDLITKLFMSIYDNKI